MKRLVFLLFLIPALLVGCSEEVEEKKPKDLVEIKGAMVLEISLLGEHRHITVRTIDEEIVVINVMWDHMPTLTVGEQLNSISYTKKNHALYEYSTGR